VDAAALYDLLEKEVIPCFSTAADGHPHAWIEMMKTACRNMRALQSHRMIEEYMETTTRKPASRIRF